MVFTGSTPRGMLSGATIVNGASAAAGVTANSLKLSESALIYLLAYILQVFNITMARH
jgi:hypothetical protein